MSEFERYYEEELRYLYESGREFARAHPDRAQFLNIDAVGDRDPYVERLFEGFSFLTARIREKLDDSFPELTEGLVNLLWPHFLMEFPSLAIAEFRPRKGHLQETRVLPKGSRLLSNPVGPESVACKFVTTYDIQLSPVSFMSIDKKSDTRRKGALSFNFQIDPGVKWQNLKIDPLRMYIHAETPTALAVHEILTRHVVRAELSFDNGRAVVPLDPSMVISAAGFKKEESLLPHDSRGFWGYALLLEYFVFPEKFFFFDFNGLSAAPILDPPPARFSINLYFDCDFPHDKPFGQEIFKLHCSPIVNLFKIDTEPVVNTGRMTEYLVRADASDSRSVVHSLISVASVDRKTGERFVYEPFYQFRNIGKKNARTFTSHYREGFNGKRELCISIGGSQLDANSVLHEENLSIEAYCTNGVLPRDEIREGMISKPGVDFPDYVMFTNITRPTLPSAPPPNEDYLWTFLSHLGATYASFGSPDRLKSFLKLYEWSRSEGRNRRIEAISDVALQPAELFYKGGIVRGIEFVIAIEESGFSDGNDMHLLGEVLREFFAQYISINSFLDLIIVARPSGVTMRWNSLRGVKWPV
ncbi:MAG: type VI secretion system baseplate subunit TssF [Chitinispirillaceae bacterium]|nr:type VI secretion system baseplate subunit TssF [Chitinispirillaceae bacterium]